MIIIIDNILYLKASHLASRITTRTQCSSGTERERELSEETEDNGGLFTSTL